MMSSLCDADLKGDIFGRTIYPPSLTVMAFILAKLWREGEGTISPLAPKGTKKARFCNNLLMKSVEFCLKVLHGPGK